MKPRFEVGEQVILQSRHPLPQNGEIFTVAAVKYDIGRTNPLGEYAPEGFRYKLNQIIPLSQRRSIEYFFESALRKLHKPGEKGYTELLESLKIPSKEKTK